MLPELDPHFTWSIIQNLFSSEFVFRCVQKTKLRQFPPSTVLKTVLKLCGLNTRLAEHSSADTTLIKLRMIGPVVQKAELQETPNCEGPPRPVNYCHEPIIVSDNRGIFSFVRIFDITIVLLIVGLSGSRRIDIHFGSLLRNRELLLLLLLWLILFLTDNALRVSSFATLLGWLSAICCRHLLASL